jgi:hypothetical protein
MRKAGANIQAFFRFTKFFGLKSEAGFLKI